MVREMYSVNPRERDRERERERERTYRVGPPTLLSAQHEGIG